MHGRRKYSEMELHHGVQTPFANPQHTLGFGQTLLTDAPVDNHGLGEAFSPTNLLSTSLAACVLTIIITPNPRTTPWRVHGQRPKNDGSLEGGCHSY